LKRDLNADEAAALGAAFRAANESTTFRVRQIGFVDRGVFSVSATINNFEDFKAGADLENAEFRKSAEIFSSGTNLKKRKAVHFKHDQELYVSVSYTTGDGLPSGTQPHIDHYNISGIVSAVEKYKDNNVTDTKPKLSLSFAIDQSGVVKLSKATATFNENVEVAIPRIKNDTSTKDKKSKKGKDKETATEEATEDEKPEESETAEEQTSEEEKSESSETTSETEEEASGDEEAATEDEASEDAAEETPETPSESESEQATGEETPSDGESAEESAEKTDVPEGEAAAAAENSTETTTAEPKIEYDYVWKTQKRKVTLKIRALGAVDVRTMNKTDMKNSTKVLLELDEADQAIRDTAAALNDLESFVLERRPLLYEDEDEFIMKVTTEEGRENLVALLTETEDWLFDVEDPTAGVFKAKMREVQKEVLPVFGRAYELSQRDYYVEETSKHIGVLREMVANLTSTHTWVNETEFVKLNESVDKFDEWFNKKVEEQNAKELTDEPAFRVEEIKKKVEKLGAEVKLIAVRPKPAEKKEKKKKKKKKDKKSNETSNANETDSEAASESTSDESPDSESTESESTETPSQDETTAETTEAEEPLEKDHEEL